MIACYYLDASALVKRYAPEAGSRWVADLTASGTDTAILLSEITLAEVAAALAAKHRSAHGFTEKQRDRALSRFLQECDEHLTLLQVDRQVIDLAVTLTQGHRLRAYDAVQLASGLMAQRDLAGQGYTPVTFVAADGDLLATAHALGLAIENPLDHQE
jgi:predicted nucleic acid-binding protein